jgi:hypothetical protein
VSIFHLIFGERVMNQIYIYGSIIFMGALLFGLLFYSFYIVLTSKVTNSQEKTGKNSVEVLNNMVSQKEHVAVNHKKNTLNPSNQKSIKNISKNKKRARKAA